MSTHAVDMEHEAASTKSARYVYFFGEGHAEGTAR